MDMEALMAQAADLQNKVAAAQEQLSQTKIKGIATGGACIVEMTGKYDVLKITIRPDVLSQGADAVADVVLSAMKDAKAKADETIDQVMGDATAGVQMPM
ncbi:MAG: YbaB/EbfC family nucleoid-associated protein [Alphaproteobacteria bacterium]|nr:YbaB/EbfC family nucleoid-associated protein [Alphaproteobacteria bacterium]